MRFRALALFCDMFRALFVLPFKLFTDTFRYTYTGNDLAFSDTAFTTSDFVSRSFTTTSPLAPNLSQDGNFTALLSRGSTALIAVIILACGSSSVFAQMPALAKLSGAEPVFSSSDMADIEAASPDQASPVLNPGARLVNSTARPFSTVGAAVSVGTLGIGGQVATPLSQRTNLRAGGNFFSYGGATYSNDGIDYTGTLKLRSAAALLDWFPFGGSFRLSPGLQFYSGLNASATLAVPFGQTFTLNHVSYASSSIVPVTGTAALTTNAVAPVFTFGWGNLVPRSEHGHFSVPFELGFVYQGAPKVSVALAGKACDPSGLNCRDVTTDTGIQSNLAAQQKIVSDDIGQYFRFYPVISIGFGYKF
jgi:hypothetical protein